MAVAAACADGMLREVARGKFGFLSNDSIDWVAR
jgi:hypothetical protein